MRPFLERAIKQSLDQATWPRSAGAYARRRNDGGTTVFALRAAQSPREYYPLGRSGPRLWLYEPAGSNSINKDKSDPTSWVGMGSVTAGDVSVRSDGDCPIPTLSYGRVHVTATGEGIRSSETYATANYGLSIFLRASVAGAVNIRLGTTTYISPTVLTTWARYYGAAAGGAGLGFRIQTTTDDERDIDFQCAQCEPGTLLSSSPMPGPAGTVTRVTDGVVTDTWYSQGRQHAHCNVVPWFPSTDGNTYYVFYDENGTALYFANGTWVLEYGGQAVSVATPAFTARAIITLRWDARPTKLRLRVEVTGGSSGEDSASISLTESIPQSFTGLVNIGTGPEDGSPWAGAISDVYRGWK